MQKLICLFLILSSSISYSQSANQKDSFKCYRIMSSIKFDKEDSVYNDLFNDTTFVFFSGKIVMFQRLNSHHYSYTSYPKSDLDFETWTSQYMIFDSTADQGLFYTDLDDIGWMNVDSFLQKMPFIEEGKNQFTEMKDILLNVKPAIASSKGDLLFETYVFNNSKDTSVKGTITFKYNTKPNRYPVSLSPGIDSLKQMTLLEIKTEMPSYFSKEKNRISNAFTMTASLDQLVISESQTFKRGLEKYIVQKQKRKNR